MSPFGALRSRSTESARPRRMPAFPCLSRTLFIHSVFGKGVGAILPEKQGVLEESSLGSLGG